ncbi:hypothetical protein DXG01_011418 [Tephrocybe rancida]|nr:hypothetical protein DXG01_011418 [Tephrocybe rancida]
MATIVLDDTTSHLSTGNTVGNGVWSNIPSYRFFGGSATYPPFAANGDTSGYSDSGNYGTLKMSFQAFIGNTPPSPLSQNIFVSIDGGPSYQAWYNDPSPPSALQWYQSPKLSDGTHTISITHIAGTSIDMMLVTAGQNTPLSGQRLIVDDSDAAITYSGSWTRKTGLYRSSELPQTGQPYGNATHQTSSTGASATFTFTGSAVWVYSVFDYSHLGSVGVTYTLDSVASSQTYSVTTDTPEFNAGVLQRENTVLWSSDSISAGQHTLKIEVTSSTNGTTFVLDYLIYTPSFDTLAIKPGGGQAATTSAIVPAASSAISTSETRSSADLSGSSTSSLSVGSSTSANTSATGVTGNTHWGTVTVTGAGAGLTSAAGAASGSSTSPGKGIPIGAVIGAVIGGVALLALIFLLILCRKRIAKSSDTRSQVSVEAILSPIEPFRERPRENRTFNAAEKGPHALVGGPYARDPFARDGNTVASGSIRHHSPARSNSHAQMSEKSLFSNSNLDPVDLLPINSPISAVACDGLGGPARDVQRTTQDMQNLQNLVAEFNRAVLVHGEANAKVAELQTQISELAGRTTSDKDSRPLGRRETVLTMTVPPPYE